MAKRPNGWYGWRADKPDIRDRYRLAPPPTAPLPDSTDLRGGLGPCYDQGDLGSCTANAIAAALQFDQRKQGLKEFMPSRLFIYYNEREIEGTIKEDSGAEIRDGIKSVNTLGAAPEKDCPYVISKFCRKPTKKAYKDAKAHPAVKYERIDQELRALQSCLAQGFPFVFGFTVYSSFEGDDVARTGQVAMPAPEEKVEGGHAVLCVGYDNHRNTFLVRNSWGADWGQNGYCTIPFAYVLNADLASDFWTIEQVQ